MWSRNPNRWKISIRSLIREINNISTNPHYAEEMKEKEAAKARYVLLENAKEKITNKLQVLNSSVTGIDDESNNDDLIKQAKNYLEDNSDKLK
jgi:hypothetical protein